MFTAGTAIRDITPKGPMMLCGYPTSQLSTGVHDPLWTSAFYFASQGVELLYLATDLCFFTTPRAKAIAAEAAEKLGIPEQNVMVSTTHTHSGPVPSWSIYEAAVGPEMYPEYLDFIQSRMVEAAAEAKENAFAASVGYAAGHCGKEQGVGGNRHSPDYAADPSVPVIAVKDMTGRVRGVLANYALHPTVIHAENTLVSADYVCYTRAAVTKAFPGAVFGLMQGCSGNQSTRYFRHGQTFEEAERIGGAIGRAAAEAIERAEFRSGNIELKAVSGELMPSEMRRIPSQEEAQANAAAAQANYDKLIAGGAPYADCRSAECTLIGANLMVVRARDAVKYGVDAIMGHTVPVRLQAFRLGECAILGLSAEAFCDIGLAIRARSKFAVTMISTLTGGSAGSYICSNYAYDQFCYEPQGSLFCRGIAKELEDAGAALLETL